MSVDPSPSLADVLPQFPWDSLASSVELARQHPGGAISLSAGTPVDDTPSVVQDALRRGANAGAYPTTVGTPELQDAIVAWFARVRNVPGLTRGNVLPTTGSKEAVAWLPTWLGAGPGTDVVLPMLAYPTYAVGAQLCGARPVPTREVAQAVSVAEGDRPICWINSPSNPTGRVMGVDDLALIVRAARERGAVVVSDECYATISWTDATPPSVLDPRVCGGDLSGLLVVHSLSKQSTMAGYRAGLLAGDEALVAAITTVRKHSGLMVPGPVQHAMAAALGDDDHVAVARQRYVARLATLRGAAQASGLTVEPGDAGLYLWASGGGAWPHDCWGMVTEFARLGIVVAPGEFYGSAGAHHVRIAATATDTAVAQAAERLSSR